MDEHRPGSPNAPVGQNVELTPEPETILGESGFEAALVDALRQELAAAGVRAVITHGFGLDIAVFMALPDGTRARFIEAKCFSPAAGRVGVGDQRGGGNQIEVLLRAPDELAIMDGAIRWALVDNARPRMSARFVVFDCATALAAASGGIARGKQNNLRLSAFSRAYVTWDEMIRTLMNFLLAPAPGPRFGGVQ